MAECYPLVAQWDGESKTIIIELCGISVIYLLIIYCYRDHMLELVIHMRVGLHQLNPTKHLMGVSAVSFFYLQFST